MIKTLISRIKPRHLAPLGAVLVADGAVFGATDPQTAPSWLLIIGFLLFTLTSYYLLKGLLAIPAVYGLPLRHKKRLLSSLTVLVASLAALQSIGQLASRDVLVLSILTLLAYLYIAHAKGLRRTPAIQSVQ